MGYTFASATLLLLLITGPLGNIPILANAPKGGAPKRRMIVIRAGCSERPADRSFLKNRLGF